MNAVELWKCFLEGAGFEKHCFAEHEVRKKLLENDLQPSTMTLSLTSVLAAATSLKNYICLD